MHIFYKKIIIENKNIVFMENIGNSGYGKKVKQKREQLFDFFVSKNKEMNFVAAHQVTSRWLTSFIPSLQQT